MQLPSFISPTPAHVRLPQISVQISYDEQNHLAYFYDGLLSNAVLLMLLFFEPAELWICGLTMSSDTTLPERSAGNSC
jgi:hypothetical protein